MRVGLIGCGGIAPTHMKVYRSIKNVSIEAVCDLDLKRAKNLASQFCVTKTFQNYGDMFQKEELDLVDICTPVSTHARIVCDAAESVPALLVEKPMALSVSECQEMITKVEKHGCELCVVHSQIFSPHIQRAKRMVDSDTFDLLSFTTIQKESFELLKAHNLAPAWNVAPELKGIIWEVCCHLAYLQLHFLPDINEVYAVGGKVKHPVYDDFAILLRTGGQRFGMIELSWLTKEPEIVYELRDKTGKRVQIYRDFDYFLEKSQNPPLTIGSAVEDFFIDEKRILQKWARLGLGYIRKRKIVPIFNLISTYIDCIKQGLPSPISMEEARNTINLLECIELSLDERRPVGLRH